jgi:phenylalanyl-tRNA synthetase beta chain
MSKNILKEAGFSEVYNYSFIGDKEANIFKYNDAVELENPMSLDYKYLRPSLTPNLIKNVESNFKYFDKVKIFELGKIFNPEKRMLSCLVAQKQGQDSFYELKGIIGLLLNKLGISDISYDDYEQTPEQSSTAIWDSKRSAEIKVGGEEIGFLGDVSKDVLNKMKIKGEVALFDIDFDKLQQLVSEEHEYQPISQHPSAIRDIAVLVPHDVKVVDVLNKINTIGGKLIRDIDLFDIYQGGEIPQGRKNLAFHIIYQAEDRTLTAKEIDEIQNKIIKTLEKDPEWEIRK